MNERVETPTGGCQDCPPLSSLELGALYEMHHFRILTVNQAQALDALIPGRECAWWECRVVRAALDWEDEEGLEISSTKDGLEEEQRQRAIADYVARQMSQQEDELVTVGGSRERLLAHLFGIPRSRPSRLLDAPPP